MQGRAAELLLGFGEIEVLRPAALREEIARRAGVVALNTARAAA